uniref:RNA-dependent RNA polymerase n=1 Tax=Mito-like albercanusvirus TaxID=2784750 RepID=A0A7S7BUW1_9VIRU|nr:RNA-dependent RNA polymerase [Mito-like albercanusvirus]
MKQMNSSTFNLTSVWSVIRTFLPRSDYSLEHCFREYRRYYDKLSRCKGRAQTIKILKAMSLAGRKVVMGYGFNRGPIKYAHNTHKSCEKFADFSCRVYHDGFPRCLSSIHRLLISRRRILNLCGVSILHAYLFMRVAPVVQFKDMTSPFTGRRLLGPPGFVQFIKWFAPRWVGKNFQRILEAVKEDPPLFAGFKGGAYGSPSIAFGIDDARTLLLDRYKVVYDACAKFENYFSKIAYTDYNLLIRTISGEDVRYFSGEAGKIPSMFTDWFRLKKKETVDRLAQMCFLSDRGGKTRVITSCNFFIQKCLSPLHKVFMETLRTIPEDYTFDQDRASATIRRWQKYGYEIYSYDMTGATDRFPAAIQAVVVETLIPFLSEAWLSLMRLPIESKGVERVFAVGQPMGLLSSWPVFAFTHHLVVRYAAYLEGLNPFTFDLYCILGDDVVIAHKKVAKRYHQILTKWLGVSISAQKSFVPRNGCPNCAEFAKRNYVDGREVTPLAPDMLHEARSNDPLLLKDIIDRILINWKIRLPRPDRFIAELFIRVLTSPDIREGVTRYMFHPMRINPLLCRIKGVREHVDRVYPGGQKFSVVEQGLVKAPMQFWRSSTESIRLSRLMDSLDKLRAEVDTKVSTMMAIIEEDINSVSSVWDAGLFPFRPAYNKLLEFVASQPILATVRAIDQKTTFKKFISLEKNYVLLIWANEYLSTGQIPKKGMWHAKRVADLEFEMRAYPDILAKNEELCTQYYSGWFQEMFKKCPGAYFTEEFPTDDWKGS